MPEKNDSPSLLDKKSTGGLTAWRGFKIQTRYIALRAPSWVADPTFVRFVPERLDDVDVYYQRGDREVRHHHQVKHTDISSSDAAQLVSEFATRNSAEIAQGSVERYVIATSSPGGDLRQLFQRIRDFRATPFGQGEDASAKKTRDQIVERTRKADFGENSDFVVDHVELYHDLGGLEPEASPFGRIAVELSELESVKTELLEELKVAAKGLVLQVEERERHDWTRDKVLELLQAELVRYRAGPSKPAGDAAFLSHATFSAVRSHPDAAQKFGLGDRRVLWFELDEVRAFSSGVTAELLHLHVEKMLDPPGAFQKALALAQHSPVIYYGFPHVPLGALAGALFGEQAEVHLVEHDRWTKQFAWPDKAVPIDMLPAEVTRRNEGHLAIVLVSVSANVDSRLVVADEAETAISVHVRIKAPHRGAIQAEDQVRAIADEVRRALDSHAAGNPEITEIRWFCAVPASVAFALGQVSRATGYPESCFYNFISGPPARYNWGLRLRAASNREAAFVTPPNRGNE